MSIRRWLRRWFGEPEPPKCLCGKTMFRETRFEQPAMSNPSGRHWWACPDAPAVTTTYFRPSLAITVCTTVPFRDTGSGDRDAGVDALVSEDRR